MTSPLRTQLAIAPDLLRRHVDPATLPPTTADVPHWKALSVRPARSTRSRSAWKSAHPVTISSLLDLPGRAASAPSRISYNGSRRLAPCPPTGSMSTTSLTRTDPMLSVCRKAGGELWPLILRAFCRQPSEKSRARSRARTTRASAGRPLPSWPSGGKRSSINSRHLRVTRVLPSKSPQQVS